jgi:hypothetical protein
MLYLYIINSQTQKTKIMESLITLYTDIFSSMDTMTKVLFIFWSICVVLFFSSFFMLIVMTIKEGIMSMVKKTPRPQRF